MRHHWVVTISDCRGARHYTLSQLARRCAAGLLGMVAATFLIGAGLVIYLEDRVSALHTELSSLGEQRTRIAAENEQLRDEQRRLMTAIDTRNRRLATMENGLARLESLIGLKPVSDQLLEQRLAHATSVAQQKSLMLRSVPRGYPVPDKGITSDYGRRTHPIHNTSSFHRGVDLRADLATKARATAEGVVTFASRSSSGLGKLVTVRHNYGFSSYYGHLRTIEVEVGDYVQQGQAVGTTGSSGAATGPHIHYSVKFAGSHVDPTPFLDWSLERYDNLFAEEKGVPWDSLERAIERTTLQLEPQSSAPVATLTGSSP